MSGCIVVIHEERHICTFHSAHSGSVEEFLGSKYPVCEFLFHVVDSLLLAHAEGQYQIRLELSLNPGLKDCICGAVGAFKSRCMLLNGSFQRCTAIGTYHHVPCVRQFIFTVYALAMRTAHFSFFRIVDDVTTTILTFEYHL